VSLYFEDGTDPYFARQLVGERLQSARREIPEGFGEPEMGPTTTGLGQILFYVLSDETGKRSPEEMREIQDWLIKFNLQTVKGVTEVLSQPTPPKTPQEPAPWSRRAPKSAQ